MAITITGQPNSFTVKGQKLVYTCTSDNIAEPRFKFIVVVKNELGTQLSEYYISPNPSGVLMFDLRKVINEEVAVDIVDSQQSDGIIHNLPHASTQQFTIAPNGCKKFEVEFGEVFVDGSGDYTPVPNLASSEIYVNDGYLQFRDGYKNTLADYQSNFSGLTKAWLLDREVEFHKESGLTGIVINTNDNESGSVAWWYNDSGLVGVDTGFVAYEIYDAGGLVFSSAATFVAANGGPSASSLVAEDQQVYGGFYPLNIASTNSVFLIGPDLVPDWTYYTLQQVNSAGTSEGSLPLIFVNNCPTSKHTSAQLAWTNSVGGWEYLTFDGRRKDQITSRSKNYTKDIGTYSDTSFGFNTFDRQETPFHVDTNLSYTLYRERASDVDTRLMASLSKSKNVMVNLEGGVNPEWLPVIVTGNNFEMQPTVSSKNQTISVKITIAQIEQA